jgi:hypothetical protein
MTQALTGSVENLGDICSVESVVPRSGWRCALRAPTEFSARIKSIRAENTVLINSKNGYGVLYEIADCARMVLSSVRNR